MARMYSRKKGKSGSTRPISKKTPQHCKYTSEEVEGLVIKIAKQGAPPSKIGLVLRDQYGIPLVKPIVGKTMTEILSSAGIAPKIPEEIDNLLKKAESLKRHLARNRSDHFNKRALSLIESKMHNLSKYYKRQGLLPEEWKYKTAVAAVV